MFEKYGKYRRARLIKEGYAVRFNADDGSEVEWPVVASALYVTAPFQATMLTFTDGTKADYDSSTQVMCRTPAEVAKAEKDAAKEAS